jgi:23S rRNA (cytidine1920-2'-O)/16S rRNA (cytidine1409-2'-O)-methyltransferase
MSPSAVPDPVALVVIDVSFISLTKVLPPIMKFLRSPAYVIALIKPQFEVGKGQVGRGGIVRDDAQRTEAVHRVVRFAADIGLRTVRTVTAPIKGKKGNQEILAILEYGIPFHGM